MSCIKDIGAGDTFQYTRRLGKDEIRLLGVYVNFSPNDQTIRCKLSTHVAADGPEYDALSYVWGDNTRTHSIMINSRPFYVTKSLFEGLTNFRNIVRKKGLIVSNLLWVDALCLNQDDRQEINQQVQQMGRIYKSATQVLILLGEVAAGFEKALPTLMDGLLKFQEDGIDANAWMSAHHRNALHIFSRPWFARVWVVQEAILAKEPILYYGGHLCYLQDLFGVAGILKDNQMWLLSWIERRLGAAMKFAKLVDDVMTFKLLYDLSREEDSMLFARAIFMARSRFCGNPRDHIYGMLGIAALNGIDAPATTLQVDYAKTTAEVFTDCTRFFMYRTQNMGFELLLSEHREADHQSGAKACSRAVDLPSWVPDWSVPGEDCSNIRSWFFRAGGDDRLWPEPSMFADNGTSLIMSGFALGTVASMPSVENIGRCENLDGAAMSCGAQAIYGELPQRVQAYRRAYCADTASSVRPESFKVSDNTRRWADCGEAFLNVVTGDFRIDMAIELPKMKWVPSSRSRPGDAVLILSTGHVGTGRASSLPGDLVVVFPGVSTPFVLRAKPCASKYAMVGPAYVHGIMDGEAMLGLAGGKYRLQDFTIV